MAIVRFSSDFPGHLIQVREGMAGDGYRLVPPGDEDTGVMPQPARHQATPDSWQLDAELHLLAERDAAAETPLLELDLPALPGRRAIFKDESAHATGSLKHRLARALLLQGLRRGAIGEGTPLFGRRAPPAGDVPEAPA